MSCKMHRIHGADDRVEVAGYEPSWQRQFERLRDRAAAALGP